MPPRLFLWLLLGLAQLVAPTWLVLQEELTLTQGHLHLFRLAPVDPTDPFRGRYMTLAFDAESTHYALSLPQPTENSCPLYAGVRRDPDGFSSLTTLSLTPPLGDYLEIPADHWSYWWKEKNTVRLQLPFRRFYLNENKAASVEQRARDLLAEARKKGEKSDINAAVRVREGHATIIDLRAPDGTRLK